MIQYLVNYFSRFVYSPSLLLFFSKYPVARHTTRLHIPYYVKENFRLDYQGSLARLEANVEEEFMSSLRNACYKERNYRKNFSKYSHCMHYFRFSVKIIFLRVVPLLQERRWCGVLKLLVMRNSLERLKECAHHRVKNSPNIRKCINVYVPFVRIAIYCCPLVKVVRLLS